MIEVDSKFFNESIRLEDGYLTCTKQQIIGICKDLSLKGMWKFNKGQLARQLSGFLLNQPTVWLNLLPEHELQLLDKLVDNGPYKPLIIEKEMCSNLLESLSLIVQDSSYQEEDTIAILIFEDLRQAIIPHIKEILNSPENKERFYLEQHFFGIMNLYGLLPLDRAFGFLQDLLPDLINDQKIKTLLLESLGIRKLLFEFYLPEEDESELFVNSPFLVDVDYLDMQLQQHSQIDRYQSFPINQILAAGQRPLPELPNAGKDELKRFLKTKMGFSDYRIRYVLCHLWLSLQIETNAMTLVTNLIGGRLGSLAELQEAIELMMDYCNQVPRWFLKGYNPVESRKLFENHISSQKPPKLIASPNMREMGLDITPEMQHYFDAQFEEVFSEKKQGRNDLCACGSGKKYKKCCGAN